MFPASPWRKKACQGVEFTVVGLLKRKKSLVLSCTLGHTEPWCWSSLRTHISLVQCLIPPCLGSACFSSLSASPALRDGCTKVALQQTDRDLKTKWAGRGTPSPVTNPTLEEKARYFPRSWEHAVPVSPQGNAIMTQQHGPFWWHGDSSGCTDAGSGVSCVPSCPESNPESHSYCRWQNTKPLIGCPSPRSCKLLPCSELRMKYCTYSVYKITITWSTGSVVDLLQVGNKIIICRWKVRKLITLVPKAFVLANNK